MGKRSESDICKGFLDSMQPCDSRKKSCHRLFFAYRGRSMNPTLWEGDILEVMPYHDASIKAGDIIVFNSPQDETFVVHRVISISSDNIHTKGDNNTHNDEWCLRSPAIIGKVIAATYSKRHRELRGGLLGLILGRWHHSMHEIFRSGIHYIPPIHKLAVSQDILCRLGTYFIGPKIAVFRGNRKSSIMLVSGRRIIGRYNYGKNQWNFNGFYRLFIDEDALPDIGRIENEES